MSLRINTANTALPFKRLILFHGSGDSSQGFAQWINYEMPEFFTKCKAKNYDVIIPDAPVQNYSLNGGRPQKVWFDRKELDINAPEPTSGIEHMCKVISEEVEIGKSGLSFNGDIIFGGFSMGSVMAYHMGLKYVPENYKDIKVSKVFGLSGFLAKDSQILKQANLENAPEVFIYHGDMDPLVPETWGRQTYCNLKKWGLSDITYETGRFGHELNRKELHHLSKWLFTEKVANEGEKLTIDSVKYDYNKLPDKF